MSAFAHELTVRLEAIRAQGLHRALRRVDSPQGPRIEIDGRSLLNFSSNDYLGLANHPALKQAAMRAVEEFGAGAGASRLLCGSLAPFHELEATLAAFKGTEAALTFSTGYAAALGTITALLSKDDLIITDKLIHASIVDAARLSGAQLRIFAHNDLNDLEDILKWMDSRRQSWGSSFSLTGSTLKRELQPCVLIVTESVFSMDGDLAPLREMVRLKEQYGAWLMVDEAHATGIYGAHRRGLAEELGVSDQIEIQMGTLGKAIGASGGYICGRRALIDLLVNRARSFIFSTAPVPAAAAAATAGIQLVQSADGEARRDLLGQRVAAFLGMTRSTGFPTPSKAKESDAMERAPTRPCGSAIIPVLIGDEAEAVETADRLRAKGFFVPAIRYPTVARGTARLRITLTAAHAEGDITALTAALRTTHHASRIT